MTEGNRQQGSDQRGHLMESIRQELDRGGKFYALGNEGGKPLNALPAITDELSKNGKIVWEPSMETGSTTK